LISPSSSNLRYQIEAQLLDSSISHISLKFRGISTQKSITLKFPKSDFVDSDFMSWGFIDTRGSKWVGMTDYKKGFIDENVRNTIEILTKLISEHGSGKVIILPAVSTDVVSSGYRVYYGGEATKANWIPKNSRFEIDLSDTQNALAQLIHIGYSMQAYDAAFIVKEWAEIDIDYLHVKDYLIENTEMICAFDYRGFLKKDEIYVGSAEVPSKARFEITDYSTNFYDDQTIIPGTSQTMFESYVNRWKDSIVTHAGMTIIGDKSDFVDYMNKIKTGTSEFA